MEQSRINCFEYDWRNVSLDVKVFLALVAIHQKFPVTFLRVWISTFEVKVLERVIDGLVTMWTFNCRGQIEHFFEVDLKTHIVVSVVVSVS